MTQHSSSLFIRKAFMLTAAVVMSWQVMGSSFVTTAYAASPTPAASPKATAKPSSKASPSPSPTPSPTPEPSSEATTQSLRDRINKVLRQRDQVAGVEDTQTRRKTGFIGEVQRVTEKTITIKTSKGSQILTLTPNVTILRDTKKITIDDIAVSDWVLVMGYTQGEEFEARRILVSTTSLRPRKYETTIGTLESIKTNQITVTPRGSKDEKTYTLVKTTKFQDGIGATIDRKALVTNSQYLFISYLDGTTSPVTLIRALATSEKTER